VFRPAFFSFFALYLLYLFIYYYYFMTQETSYFYQNQPASNTTKKKPTSGLLGRRQQNASYLQQLELPSLPPLSQMLTDKTDENKSKTVYNDAKKAKHANHNISSETDTTQHHHHTNPTANTTAAAAVAAGGVMPAYPPAATQVPSQPMYFGDYTMNSDPTTSSLEQRNMVVPVVNTTNGAMLMDGTAGTFAPANMMPLDSMYPMSSALSTDPTAAVMAAAYMNNGGQRARQASSSSTSSTDKIYSFVAIPGTNQRKRPRRRYDEIERLYHCNWPGCTKAYGTLNHLNAHVSMQKHVSLLY
jgi:hypothetical protein